MIIVSACVSPFNYDYHLLFYQAINGWDNDQRRSMATIKRLMVEINGLNQALLDMTSNRDLWQEGYASANKSWDTAAKQKRALEKELVKLKKDFQLLRGSY